MKIKSKNQNGVYQSNNMLEFILLGCLKVCLYTDVVTMSLLGLVKAFKRD